MWRLGHRNAPLDFIPLELCGWQHRWDDPRRAYRTLYCAQDAITCLREVLADLRPNTEMLAELEELFGSDAALSEAAGAVTEQWRAHRGLRSARPAGRRHGRAAARADDRPRDPGGT